VIGRLACVLPLLLGAACASPPVKDAQGCVAAGTQTAACQYDRAIALGNEARAHPAQAGSILNQMLASLAQAEATDPGYDSAGPARVRALVLARAPAWPLGPGDPDQAVEAAQRAVMLHPEYPPNWLALAESQAKIGAAERARDSAARAREAALALPQSADREEWLREATQLLGGH
jgi:hypothetical protein